MYNSSLVAQALSPIRECHYCTLRVIVPRWSLWFIGITLGRTVGCFSPLGVYKAPSSIVKIFTNVTERKSGREGLAVMKDKTREDSRSVVLALGHLNPLDHILQDSVHSSEGIFSLR